MEYGMAYLGPIVCTDGLSGKYPNSVRSSLMTDEGKRIIFGKGRDENGAIIDFFGAYVRYFGAKLTPKKSGNGVLAVFDYNGSNFLVKSTLFEEADVHDKINSLYLFLLEQMRMAPEVESSHDMSDVVKKTVKLIALRKDIHSVKVNILLAADMYHIRIEASGPEKSIDETTLCYGILGGIEAILDGEV